MFNKRRHFRSFDGIPKMLSNRAYIRAFIKNKLRMTVLWSWTWPFSMIFVNILPNDGISKDTVKNIKIRSKPSKIQSSPAYRWDLAQTRQSAHNITCLMTVFCKTRDGIFRGRAKKNSAFRCVEKIRSNLKKNEKCCHGKNAVFFEILSWRYFCINFFYWNFLRENKNAVKKCCHWRYYGIRGRYNNTVRRVRADVRPDGRRRRACCQRRWKNNDLIEAASLGRLDQMWRTTV